MCPIISITITTYSNTDNNSFGFSSLTCQHLNLFFFFFSSLLSVFFPAHCLHTVTEDNPELLCSMNTAVLGALETVLLSSQPGMAHTLLRTLAAGTICHFVMAPFFPPLNCTKIVQKLKLGTIPNVESDIK